ncbi:MAG: putative oxidoreductase YjmC [Bacteroidetes bacterium ADurb.Bin408]|nr:MAG: putative oxidoreductase YjmC [Bacteroidetes bacterium ADurb.Bin408]
MTEEVKWIPFDVVEKFMIDVLAVCGVPQTDAEICADVLITADKYGIDSHGSNRLKPIYYDRIKEGILNPVTHFEVVRDGLATAVIDGHNGMGHVIAKKAMQMAIDKASTFGMGMVAVRNSTHYGIAGYYALMAAKNNMIGITGTNARPSIAPTFGVENMLGTNPLTFGMPSDEDFPFLLDCATSITQRGKIELYARQGKACPEGWVIDENGNATTDATRILDDLNKGKAALSPLGGIGEDLGGYKGYGYATVVEILSAALQNGAFLKMLLGIENGKKVPYPLGHFFIAIDVKAFVDVDDFKKTTGDILRTLRNSKKMPGQKRIYTAGEKEYETWMYRKNKGVPFNKQLLNEFYNLAVETQLTQYGKYFK